MCDHNLTTRRSKVDFEQERQRHEPTSSTEPSGTEFDRHKERKRDPDDNGITVRRKYDEEGDAEFAELLLKMT